MPFLYRPPKRRDWRAAPQEATAAPLRPATAPLKLLGDRNDVDGPTGTGRTRSLLQLPGAAKRLM